MFHGTVMFACPLELSIKMKSDVAAVKYQRNCRKVKITVQYKTSSHKGIDTWQIKKDQNDLDGRVWPPMQKINELKVYRREIYESFGGQAELKRANSLSKEKFDRIKHIFRRYLNYCDLF